MEMLLYFVKGLNIGKGVVKMTDKENQENKDQENKDWEKRDRQLQYESVEESDVWWKKILI